jgi:hypothetical protein
MPNPNTFVQTILLEYMNEHSIDPSSDEGKLFLTSLGLLQTTSIGSSPIQTATVTLTDAQIKTLPTVSQIIIPALGLGKAIWADAALGGGRVLFQSHIVQPYTNISSDASVFFAIANNTFAAFGGPTEGYRSATGMLSNLLGVTGENYQFLSSLASTGEGDINSQPNSEIDNIALAMDFDNALGNLTGGNSANTLKITVDYTVITLQ